MYELKRERLSIDVDRYDGLTVLPVSETDAGTSHRSSLTLVRDDFVPAGNRPPETTTPPASSDAPRAVLE